MSYALPRCWLHRTIRDSQQFPKTATFVPLPWEHFSGVWNDFLAATTGTGVKPAHGRWKPGLPLRTGKGQLPGRSHVALKGRDSKDKGSFKRQSFSLSLFAQQTTLKNLSFLQQGRHRLHSEPTACLPSPHPEAIQPDGRGVSSNQTSNDV